MPVPVPAVRDPRDTNLAAIVRVADQMQLGDAGRLVGVMTALTESDLFMQANANNPLSLVLPYDRVSQDKDSLGLYAQRVRYWGTGTPDERTRQLMDPATSARLFYEALERVPGWRTLDPWVAAQTVQRSQFTDGSNYKARMAAAQAALAGGPNYFTSKGK